MPDTVLYRLAGSPSAAGTTPLPMLKRSSGITSAVIWASATAIAGGYGGSLFGPDDKVNREQFAVIVYNYTIFKGYNDSETAKLTAC
jgi:hypothetical protein